jgi:hypothetical protein
MGFLGRDRSFEKRNGHQEIEDIISCLVSATKSSPALKSTLIILVPLLVIPAQAGIQSHILLVPCLRRDKAWIPVFTGMTISMPKDSDAHDRPISNLVKDRSLLIGR